MAIFRGEGGAGDADNDVTVTTVTEKATEAANSATAAAASATQSANSASAAATSATNAATSESNASTSATSASTSATNAATSETNASTSETNAATSATNAATSATNAAASYDDFDDRYLGAKASDPSTDNDGDALITGALYFNTVSNAMQVYNGTAWTALTGTGAAEVNDLTSAVTWANVPDANITQSSVTQHQAALSITESQISDLGSYITASSTDTLTNKSGNISQWTNDSSYLTGNQTITLSGDVSGSGTTAITVTVADDSHNHVISNVDGLQTALDAKLESVAINDVSDVVITTPADNEVLAYDNTSGNWINQTASEAGLLTTEVNDLTSAVTWANVPDANITQSSVTQHQAALSITESQISDLQSYLTTVALNDVSDVTITTPSTGQVLKYNGTIWVNDADTGGIDNVVEDTTPQLGGDLDLNSSDITGTGNIDITGTVTSDGLTVDTTTLHVDATNNRVGIGTTSPGVELDIVGSIDLSGGTTEERKLQIGKGRTGDGYSYIDLVGDATYSDYGLRLIRSNGGANTTSELVHRGTGALNISAVEAASILFKTSNAERMRLTSGGILLMNTTDLLPANNNVAGVRLGTDRININRSAGTPAIFGRTNDGALVNFHSAGTNEGNISVSGTTVSYNGGHLARWSQLADNTRDTSIVKGTVMSNLDQMAEWTTDGVTEDNEQLNCMKVSDVEGDANVAGVFVNWDDDDDIYTNDMNIAMTGDMVIRIAQGTTVQRGDLLMSAGDGTAKPQGDDIVRSKTIAKVTSTTVSSTYDDGSYLVPCVLMAC